MPLSLPDLFRVPLESHLHRGAVSMPGGPSLTYAELDRESARLATTLRRGGVVKGSRVALVVPKSLEGVVGVWAILRAGASYVPIDPGSPPDRAAMLVRDAQVSAVLASKRLARVSAAAFSAAPSALHVTVHGSEAADGGFELGRGGADGEADGAFSPSDVTPRDLAYILYTSGSTGAPKGVMISHSAALTFVEWAARRFELGCGDVVGGHAPFHFDLSTFDLYATALAGGRLVLFDEEAVRFPMTSVDVVEDEGISVLYAVPSALRRMMRMGRLGERSLERLRLILFAGETFPAEELRELQSCLSDVALFNLFGPTETNVCTYWEVPRAGTWDSDPIPIGIDVEGCETVVVNTDLEPVADGAQGELLVRGGSLLEGYWGDPERTRLKLIPDFLHPHLSDRLFRTGDLVSRRADGSYAFHGRLDHQVKVRGYRIELGEVETALLRMNGVVDAAAVAVEDGSDEAGPEVRLVAFVVCADGKGGEDAVDEIRRELMATLPRYMIPASLLCVSSLPLTSNGKVDRQHLIEIAKQPRERGGQS